MQGATAALKSSVQQQPDADAAQHEVVEACWGVVQVAGSSSKVDGSSSKDIKHRGHDIKHTVQTRTSISTLTIF